MFANDARSRMLGQEYAPGAVVTQGADIRSVFISRVYSHLFGAILAFTLLEIAMFRSGIADQIAAWLFTGGMGAKWLLVLGGFMLVGWLGSAVAMSARSMLAQYLALATYVVMEAIVFIPLLYIAQKVTPGGGVIESAAAVTLIGFACLTAIVFTTRKDFSFLRPVLMWGGLCALMLIVAAIIFGFNLGLVFSIAMVAFAGGAVLYETSAIMRYYPEDRYISASLSLFASVALMFWYVLRIFMEMSRNR